MSYLRIQALDEHVRKFSTLRPGERERVGA
jgi:hypothetical protein